MTFRTAIAAPFKHTRKTGMKKNELVYYYALDRKWMSTEQANHLLRRAEEAKLISVENGVYTPLFDVGSLTIPIGFKPTSAIFEQHDPSEELIARIARATRTEETEVAAGMNRLIREGFDANLLPAAALVILARQADVPFADLEDALLQSIKKG
ncbi:MAG: DUF2240 family protein [Methanomicrobiales archaeon]|nr:DUF2240 family protein [Methanomicrobiales archaeon]